MGPNDVTTDQKCETEFAAPEVLQANPYSHSADTWSLGVILYFMLTATLPFEKPNLEKQICEAEPDLDLVLKEGFCEQAKDLVMRMLDKEPENRINIDAVTVHEWFTS